MAGANRSPYKNGGRTAQNKVSVVFASTEMLVPTNKPVD